MNQALRYGLSYPLLEEAADDMTKGGGGGDDKTKENEAPTMEDRARRMGWVPQEEFRGDKAKWTDAATFVKNGEESLPILRERLRASETAREGLERSVKEFKTASETNFQKGYEKAKKELEAEIKAKAKAGDDAGAAAAATELAELEGEKVRREAKAAEDPVFDAWEKENASWYTDPDLRAEAEVEAFRLRKKGEKSEGAAFLNKVKDELKKRFPEKFENPRRREAASTERSQAGGDESTRGGGKKGWEGLPADAKEAGERYIKQKLFKDKAEYAASYWAQN